MFFSKSENQVNFSKSPLVLYSLRSDERERENADVRGFRNV